MGLLLHGQVFDHHHVMVADQGRGGAVQEIGADGIYARARQGSFTPGCSVVAVITGQRRLTTAAED